MGMNPEIKASWVAALRSGEYDQGEGLLKFNETETEKASYCCLGVLCDLAVQAGVLGTPHRRASGSWSFGLEDEADPYNYLNYSETVLPDSVREWAGLENTDPCFQLSSEQAERFGVSDIDSGFSKSLTGLNDNGNSFKTIADVIEEIL